MMIFALISRVKQRGERTVSSYVRKVALIAAAVLFLLFAAAFGLVAAYHALIDPGGFRPLEATAIVGGGLLALGLLLLAALPLANRLRREAAAIEAPAEALALVDKGLSSAARQVGPLPLVMIALAAGFLVARR